MNERIVKDLIRKRKDLKSKLKLIKSEQLQAKINLEKTYKPISEPIYNLIKNIKTQPLIKSEDGVKKDSSLLQDLKKNKIEPVLPTSGISFLEDVFLSDGDSTIRSEKEDSADETLDTIRKEDIINESIQPAYREYLENFDPLPRYYVDTSIKDTNDEMDHKHGLRHDLESDKFTIGDTLIDFHGKDIIMNNLTYPGTVGLYELLFLKNPQTYTVKDLDNYMDILKRTNAYRKNYKSDEQIQGTTSIKYLTIIKPYLQKKGLLKQSISQSSFTKPSGPLTRRQHKRGGNLMKLSNNQIDYIYFDDPNELVNRLRILVASQLAGHTGHNNEIMSIIEELKEAKIII